MSAPDWLTRAACAGMPIAVFFPERSTETTVAAARAVCLACPVRAECLTDALATETYQREGIRAGLTGRQRRTVSAGKDPDSLTLNVPIGPVREALARVPGTYTAVAEKAGVSTKAISSIRTSQGRTIVQWKTARAVIAAVDELYPIQGGEAKVA